MIYLIYSGIAILLATVVYSYLDDQRYTKGYRHGYKDGLSAKAELKSAEERWLDAEEL